MTLHHNFPRLRGLTTVNASTDPTALVGQINTAFEEFKSRHRKEQNEISADMTRMNSEFDRINKQMAAMKIGGGSTPPAHFGGFGDEATALAEFGRTGAHFNASLSSDDLGKGGAVVMPAVSNKIKIRQFDQSALARMARRVPIESGDSFEEPWDLGDVGAKWVGEREARPETETPDFHLLTVYLQEMYCLQPITQRLLDDSAYPLGDWLAGRIADKIGRLSGAAFMAGDGIKKPRGLTTYDRSAASDGVRPWVTIQALYTGVSAAFATVSTTVSAADILIDAIYALKAEFRRNAAWIMNSKTAGTVRKLKDADGRFIWIDSIAAGQPPLLLGYPVQVDEFAPDIGADAAAIWFGDFAEAYLIVDRPGIRLLRDPFTNKPNVLFYAYSRVGGALQNSEAVKAIVFGIDPA